MSSMGPTLPTDTIVNRESSSASYLICLGLGRLAGLDRPPAIFGPLFLEGIRHVDHDADMCVKFRLTETKDSSNKPAALA